MKRRIIDLPSGLGPLASDWFINVRGQSAGDGITGNGQVVYGLQPRWEANIALAGVERRQVLIWRSILAAMRGRLNVLRVRVCDAYRPTWKELGWTQQMIDEIRRGRGVPHSDTAYFNDSTGYDHEPTVLAGYKMTRGSTHIDIWPGRINNALQPGHYFSHNDWLYMVTHKEIRPNGSYRLQIEPPLRRDIPQGTEIHLEAKALMVFETDLEGRLNLDLGRFGAANLRLIEWVNRP